jgi:cytochrome P450
MFISVYNMHRDPRYWPNPDHFDPDRFSRPHSSPDAPNWGGYSPDAWKGLYPSEASANFAYLPFGGGQRKCVGDQFALLETTAILAMLVRRYDFTFAAPTATPDKVGTNTGATIHTANGLWMSVEKRVSLPTPQKEKQTAVIA